MLCLLPRQPVLRQAVVAAPLPQVRLPPAAVVDAVALRLAVRVVVGVDKADPVRFLPLLVAPRQAAEAAPLLPVLLQRQAVVDAVAPRLPSL